MDWCGLPCPFQCGPGPKSAFGQVRNIPEALADTMSPNRFFPGVGLSLREWAPSPPRLEGDMVGFF